MKVVNKMFPGNQAGSFPVGGKHLGSAADFLPKHVSHPTPYIGVGNIIGKMQRADKSFPPGNFCLRHQTEAMAAVLDSWREFDRVLLVLPTGAGKTVVFAQVAKQRLTAGRVLILAHREELLSQAADKLATFAGLRADLERAEHHAGRDSEVVLASVQTLRGDKTIQQEEADSPIGDRLTTNQENDMTTMRAEPSPQIS